MNGENWDPIKEAEQNVLRLSRVWLEINSMLDALGSVGRNMTHDRIGRDKFFEGLDLMRQGVLLELAHALSQCFHIVGVGGEDVLRFSRERLREVFDEKDRHNVMVFLDKYGRWGGGYLVAADEEFRRQVKAKLGEYDD